MELMLFLYVVLIGFAGLVQGQDQSGFTSIDCGFGSSYTDEKTGIFYEPDEDFVETGINANVSSEFISSSTGESLRSLRSFPDGDRNCYNVKYREGTNIIYLVRASFFYGNYDSRNKTPEFDLFLGVNNWTRVKFNSTGATVIKEIIHVATTDDIDICLVKTTTQTPFISAIELRPLPDSTYQTQFSYLKLFRRLDFGSTDNQTVRYMSDDYDRIWRPPDPPKGLPIRASAVRGTLSESDYRLPALVMATAVTATGNETSLSFSWIPEELKCYVYMHFAEVEQLNSTESREFDIYLNKDTLFNDVALPGYQLSTTMSQNFTLNGPKLEITLNKTARSTHTPLLNAVEIFMVGDFVLSPTERKEVEAMREIKFVYGVKKNWQGDPCVPSDYKWDGLECKGEGVNSRIITVLDLSDSELTGKIDPSFGNLTSLQELDLSNNSLSGQVPEFLANLPALKILNLKDNQLTGPVPQALIEKSKSGLTLSLDSNLCDSDPCNKDDKSPPVAAIVAPIAAVLVLFIVFTILWKLRRGKKAPVVKSREEYSSVKPESHVESTEESSPFESHNPVFISGEEVRPLESKQRRFKHSEIVSITNNFEKVVGKGGFGTVYYGRLKDNTEVAIKMLSQTSFQGSKEFRAEATLLMTVHHKNLTSLIGFCDEDAHMGLIYEYMTNGNLQWHLSDRSRNILNWEERIRIAVDAAQGLEYLHDGISPPVVHRDVKTSNILLDESFQAKLSDFGLSKAFPVESQTGVTTEVCGTPGYLDPEYYAARRLTKKSDTYSFGIVLLEIVTGRSAIIKRNNERTHIVDWIKDVIQRGDIENIVDPCLKGVYDTNSAWKAIEIAMMCVSTNPNERPTMSSVLMELKECLKMEVARQKNHEKESDDSMGIFSLNNETGASPLAR